MYLEKKKKDKKKHDGYKNQYQTYKFVNIMNMDSKYLTHSVPAI